MKEKQTNFIIFGQGRTGSSLLRNLLNSHPEVNCDAEILHKNRLNKKFGFLRHLIARYPIPYIYYNKSKSKNSIFGFKLFYHHLNNIEPVVTTIYKKGWKIIHLQRDNILKQSISWMVANQNNTWGGRIDTENKDNTYYINPEKLYDHTRGRLKKRELENQLMTKFEHLNIIYEYDLYQSDNWLNTSRKIFDFLDIYPVEVQTKWIKTDQRPDSERISNFKEIMIYMKNNGFAHLVSRYDELSKYY